MLGALLTPGAPALGEVEIRSDVIGFYGAKATTETTKLTDHAETVPAVVEVEETLGIVIAVACRTTPAKATETSGMLQGYLPSGKEEREVNYLAHPPHAVDLPRIMIRTSIGVALILISSVALARHVYPQSLEAVEAGQAYILSEDYVLQEKAATFTLFAGRYVQRYEDAKAVYLMGDAGCFQMSVVPPKNPAASWSGRWDCGVFLPKNAKKGAAVFVVRRTPDKPHKGSGVLIDGVIRAGYGSFDFPTSGKDDPVLRSKLIPEERRD